MIRAFVQMDPLHAPIHLNLMKNIKSGKHTKMDGDLNVQLIHSCSHVREQSLIRQCFSSFNELSTAGRIKPGEVFLNSRIC